LIRSRRRRALLRAAGSTANPSPGFCSEDIRPTPSRFSAGTASAEVPTIPWTGSATPLGQCILDLERLSLFAAAMTGAGRMPHARTATDPPAPH